MWLPEACGIRLVTKTRKGVGIKGIKKVEKTASKWGLDDKEDSFVDKASCSA